MRGKKILNFSIIAISFTVLMFAFVAVTPSVFAGHCTTTVTTPDSIQDVVDAASSGDVVCLSGTFSQSILIGPENSGITLSEADSATAILDGTGPASCTAGFTICRFNVDWGILLLDGVSNITIENLEIRNYDDGLGGGGQGNAIQAWDVSTSNIIVRNNYMHGNQWNGVLVGSEGGNGKIHSDWMVRNNDVKDNGFVGIELTNCNSCTIMKNNVDDNLLDIVVQARNTIAGTGQVAINGVNVLRNTVGSSFIGIYVLSFTGNPTNFSPITDASTLLTNVNMKHNTVTDSTVSEIRFWAFNNAATAENGKIIKNVLNCDFADSATGIEILERGLSGQTGTVKNVKVVNNKVDIDCTTTITNEGEATKLPPGGPFP